MKAEEWFYKGEEFDQQGNPAEALACFEKALEIDPKSAYTWYSKGVALGKLGRPDEELASYDRALEVNPSFPEAWFNKAITLGNARRFREALECFVKAQALGYPDAEQGIRFCQQALVDEAAGSTADSEVWLKKGTDLFVQGGSSAEALDCFAKALAINPQIERAWWGRGLVLLKLGRLDESLAAFDQASAVNPSGTGPLSSKAGALFNAARFQEALACYEKARELGDPKAIQGMIMCRQALGQPLTG
jgi:tetratricopeptide (TPR) repeat protein